MLGYSSVHIRICRSKARPMYLLVRRDNQPSLTVLNYAHDKETVVVALSSICEIAQD